MQINKKRHISIAVATILVLVIALVMIIVTPVKKEELYGEYFEIAGIFVVFPPYYCCVFRNIDSEYFYESRSVYKDFRKSEIVEHNLEEKCNYTFRNNILSFWLPGCEREIRQSFFDKGKFKMMVEYRAIKIGTKVILLSRDNYRILLKIDRKEKISPGSKNN